MVSSRRVSRITRVGTVIHLRKEKMNIYAAEAKLDVDEIKIFYTQISMKLFRYSSIIQTL